MLQPLCATQAQHACQAAAHPSKPKQRTGWARLRAGRRAALPQECAGLLEQRAQAAHHARRLGHRRGAAAAAGSATHAHNSLGWLVQSHLKIMKDDAGRQ